MFAVLFLDRHQRPIAFEPLFYGSIASAPVYPRVVLKRALDHNCASVILAHNHPLCFVQGVTVEREEGCGLAPSSRIMSSRPGRQVAARACDGRAAA